MTDLNTLPDVLKPYKDNIKKTIKPVIDITLSEAEDLPLWASKIGGHPYLPLTHDYPHDSQGIPLSLLAQINLAEVPANDQLPSEGMLSFFITCDEHYGLDINHPTKQNGFRVLYFDNVIMDLTQLWQDFSDIDAKIAEYESFGPIKHEQPNLAITFNLTEREISFRDLHFEDKALAGRDFWSDVTQNNDELSSEILEKQSLFNGKGHHLLGYPFFTQADPRENDIYQDYILLFQLDTDYHGDYQIMWGDGGVGNFFIHPNDLENKVFSKVLYNWDCY